MPDTGRSETPGAAPSPNVRVIGRETVFCGSLLHVRVDRLRLGTGDEVTREIVEHPGAVAVVACVESAGTLLVRQYRHAVGTSLWEIPAGKLEPKETLLECARRELAEETGYRARQWALMGSFFTSPGFSNERISLFLATDLDRSDVGPDHDVSACIIASRQDLEAMSARGELVDAKTLLGLRWAGLLPPPAGTVS